MNDRIKKLLQTGMWIVLGLLLIRYLIGGFETVKDYVSAASEVITLTMFFMGLYAKFLWKFNPLEKLPKIIGEYEGEIEFIFDEVESKKMVTVKINQTLLTTNVCIITDEISSNTLTSSLLLENGEYVLYYTYITNPKSKYSFDNPINLGTCRLQIWDRNHLSGKYWTSRHTSGDISLERKLNKK